jgi:predicted DNA-binding transcriptional regulator AlpA
LVRHSGLLARRHAAPPECDLWKIAEVAAYFRVTARTVAGWVARGVFPHPIRVGPGGQPRWRSADVRAFAASAAGKAPP